MSRLRALEKLKDAAKNYNKNHPSSLSLDAFEGHFNNASLIIQDFTFFIRRLIHDPSCVPRYAKANLQPDTKQEGASCGYQRV